MQGNALNGLQEKGKQPPVEGFEEVFGEAVLGDFGEAVQDEDQGLLMYFVEVFVHVGLYLSEEVGEGDAVRGAAVEFEGLEKAVFVFQFHVNVDVGEQFHGYELVLEEGL